MKKRGSAVFQYLPFCSTPLRIALWFGLSAALPAAHAASLVWTNTAGGNWNTAANWSPNQVPGATDSATIALGVNITNNSPSTVSNFTFSSATLKGSGPLTVVGTMNWQSGDLSSALVIGASGTLTVSNAVTFSYNNAAQNGGGSLTNLGTVIWAGSGTTTYGYGGSVIYNAGLWQAVADNSLHVGSGTNIFLNAGAFQKSGGSGTTTINWAFTTTGSVDTPTGSITVGNWAGNSTLHGTANINPGTLSASLTVASNGVMNWLSGDLSGGALTIAAAGKLTITNSVTFGYNNGFQNGGGTLTNYGTVIWAGNGASIYSYGSAVIHNAGLWEAVADNSLLNGSGTNFFVNTGAFQKAAGSGTTTINWAFNTTGTVDTPSGS